MARTLRRLLVVVLVLLALAAAGAYIVLRLSLPRIDGERSLAGLTAPVAIARDALGVADVVATTRTDALRALGYVHAQERYFEMDLMRRVAAGELAELFGARALVVDRVNRMHRFRARASAVLALGTAEDRERLDAYVAGVNAGLMDLTGRPFAYLLLGTTPRAWVAEDSILVAYAMFFDLQDETNYRERALERMHAALPPSLYAFLTAPGTAWDAPLDGTAFAVPPTPPASDVDLRKLDKSLFGKQGVSSGGDLGLGSNNFAVGGALTAHGAGMVANDMHLGLRVPNIWFRARIAWQQPQPVTLSGVTLPGLPALIAGSAGRIAWGFTNSYGDWLDWVNVHWLDDAKTRYRTANGDATVVVHRETLRVAGGADETLDVRETIWGPILHDEDAPRSLALAWTAHRPDGVGLGFTALETAASVAEAIPIAQRSAIPQQNFVVVDAQGHLGWTIVGRIPKRAGFDATRPADWLAADTGWLGWLEPASYPAIVDPPDARLWTANARTVGGAGFATIGDGGYALGARAGQIRDGLRARERFEPKDFLAIQLDDRTLFMARWWRLLRTTLERANDPALAELERLTQRWDDYARVDARAYRYTRAFRLFVHEAVVDGLAGPMRAHDADFALPAVGQGEGLVWQLLEERPPHLVSPLFADWDALLTSAARRVVDELGTRPGGLAARTWGERNTTAIRHPLSSALPGFGWLLDAPAEPLPGDSAMPRVQAPAFGASERFAVAPGHEDEAYLHMPGGQSGHPLSPFYRAGHAAWATGTPTPFLPGAAEHTLTLAPP